MDAWIGFAGVVLASIIGAWALFASSTRKAKEEAAEKERKALEAAQENTGTLSPTHSFDEVSMTTAFDDHCVGKHRWRCTGVTPRQDYQNLKIPYKHSLDSPKAKLVMPHAKELDDSPVSVTFIPTTTTDQLVDGNIVFNGACMPSTKNLGYEVEQEYVGAFCMTRAEAEEAYKNSDWKTEYLSVFVSVPMNVLRIGVTFPPSHYEMRPKPNGIVFIGRDTETVQSELTKQIKDTVGFDGKVASLTVWKPQVGLRYAIEWMPPIAKPPATPAAS